MCYENNVLHNNCMINIIFMMSQIMTENVRTMQISSNFFLKLRSTGRLSRLIIEQLEKRQQKPGVRPIVTCSPSSLRLYVELTVDRQLQGEVGTPPRILLSHYGSCIFFRCSVSRFFNYIYLPKSNRVA